MSPELISLQKNHIQKVCGKFLYDSQLVNKTQLHSINELGIKATTATTAKQETQKALIQLFNYCVNNPQVTIIFMPSDLILSCDSDTTYLVAPTLLSRAEEYHYLGNRDGT